MKISAIDFRRPKITFENYYYFKCVKFSGLKMLMQIWKPPSSMVLGNENQTNSISDYVFVYFDVKSIGVVNSKNKLFSFQ